MVEGLQGEITAKIDGPDLSGVEVKSSPAGSIRYPGTDRVGSYSLSVPDQPVRLFAVNLLDSDESNVEPQRELTLSGSQVQAQQRALSRSNLPLWPLLVGLAMLLVCLEWLVYNLKVKL